MLGNAIEDDVGRDETGMMRGWIRESDSKYIKLAKQRGRKDLLQIRERPPPGKEAKPYPRVDWFDHNPEQDQQDDSTVRKVYLPDYMVHEEYNPETYVDEQEGKRPPPRRPPFSLQDKMTVFQREGDSVTDKMHVKLPEIKPTGRRPPKKDKGKKEDSKSQSQKRYPNAPVSHDKQEKPAMGKLLNFGYQHEWYDQREKYYEHQKKIQTQQPPWESAAADQGSRLTTEYRDAINPGGKKAGKGQGSPRSKRIPMTKKTEAMEKARQEDKEKDLFKMSKFEKVGPKINSHWSDGPRLSDQEKLDTYTQQLDEMTRA